MFCHYGENVTSQFDTINYAIYDCDWYLFPNEVQRILPTVMMSTQKQMVLRGLGNVVCTREAFKRVI